MGAFVKGNASSLLRYSRLGELQRSCNARQKVPTSALLGHSCTPAPECRAHPSRQPHEGSQLAAIKESLQALPRHRRTARQQRLK